MSLSWPIMCVCLLMITSLFLTGLILHSWIFDSLFFGDLMHLVRSAYRSRVEELSTGSWTLWQWLRSLRKYIPLPHQQPWKVIREQGNFINPFILTTVNCLCILMEQLADLCKPLSLPANINCLPGEVEATQVPLSFMEC